MSRLAEIKKEFNLNSRQLKGTPRLLTVTDKFIDDIGWLIEQTEELQEAKEYIEHQQGLVRVLQRENDFLSKAHKTNLKIAEDMQKERNQYKQLAESQANVLESFIIEMAEIKERMDNVRGYVVTANKTVSLEEHDESLHEAIVSLNYIIDYALGDIEKDLIG